MKAFEEGTILKSIYTNDFFQVVKATPKMVTIKAIGTECIGDVRIMTAHSYETAHLPVKDTFRRCPWWPEETSETGKRCRVKDCCPARPGTPYITWAKGMWAIPWEGDAAIVDHYS